MRPFLTFWHRYIGLVLIPLLTVVALTGALLAWNAPLERVFAPSLFRLPSTENPAGSVLDVFALRDKALAAFPNARIDGVDLTRLPNAPMRFYLSALPGSPPLAADEISLDPATGQVLGARRYGDLSQGMINVMPFIYRLHDSLALGSIGATMLGIAALLWFADCLLAVALTFPARADPPRRPSIWLQKWREAWAVRFHSGAWRLQFDLHRAGALWPWLLMATLALSGVAFNLPQVYRPAIRTLAPYDSVYDRLPDASDTRAPALDLRAGYAAAKKAMTLAAAREGFVVRAERLIYYDASKHAYAYRVHSDRDAGSRATTQIFVDADTGATLALDLPSRRTDGNTVTDWITNLHTGKVFGWPMQVFLTLTGIAIITLNVTGIRIYLRKRRARA